MAQVTTGSPHFIETQSANNLAHRATGMTIPAAPTGYHNVITAVKIAIAKAYGVGLPPGEFQQRAFVEIGGTRPTGIGSAPVSTTPYSAAGTYTEVAVSRDLPSTLAQGAVLTTALTTPTTPGADANYSGLMTILFSGWVGVTAVGSVDVVHVNELGAAYDGISGSESFTLYECTVDYDVVADGGGGGAAPVVSFTRSPGSGVVGTSFTVTDTSTNSPTSVSTDWGDGSPASYGSPVSHAYTTTGTKTITHIAANLAGAGTAVTQTVTVSAIGTAGTLRSAAITRGKRMGASVQAGLLGDTAYATALATHFNACTAENEMKLDWLWGFGATRSAGNFAAADQIVAFANANGLAVRGHTLAWGQSWFSNLIGWLNNTTTTGQFQTLIQGQINDTLAHFAGNVRRWDVVNEVYEYQNSGLYDNNVYSQRLGANWVEQVFQWAHAADPTIECWWNETNMEQNTLNLTAWRAKVRQMVLAGVPIHGVGLQCHLFFGNPDMAPIIAAIQDFRSLGLKVAITEMDVPVGTYQWWPLTRTTTDQANIYADFAHALFDNGGEEMTVWGVDHPHSWYETPYGPVNGWPAPRNALLLDGAYATNPAYTAVLGVLNGLDSVVPSPPVASFTVSPTSGNAPVAVTVTNTSTNNPTSIDIDWGDGSTHATTSPATKTYATAGTKTITLTATNAQGSTSTTRTVTVTTASVAPVAIMSLSPRTEVFAPTLVRATNLSTGGPTSTEWDWGDGTTSAEFNAAKVLAQPGFYPVTLTVSNSQGSDSTTEVLWVADRNPRPDVVVPAGGRAITLYGVDGSVWDCCSGPVAFGADPALWGMPAVGITERSSFGVPGSTVTARRHNARDMVVPVVVMPDTAGEVEELVSAFARAVDPNRGDVIIRVTRADGTAREISATYMAGWDMLTLSDNDASVLHGSVGFRAGDPYWAATTDETLAFDPAVSDFETGSAGTAFDAAIGFDAAIPVNGTGGSGIVIVDVVNDGDVAAWPSFEAVGPATIVEASNLTTGESWQLDGGISAGSHLSIVTQPGMSQVRVDDVNAYGALSDSSTLWALPPGTSQVAIRFDDSIDGQSSIYMTFTPRYLTC